MAGGLGSLRSVCASVFSVVHGAFAAIILAAVVVVAFAASGGATAARANASDLMCGLTVQPRTQSVAITPDLAATGVTQADVVAAFKPWNDLFIEYHGFPIFAEASSQQDADILVTTSPSGRTWVETKCIAGFAPGGNIQSVVYLGSQDAWRNLQMLPHELGHTLGFADFGTTTDLTTAHIGYKPCDGTYIGVMSYCTSYQSWFLDLSIPGIQFDGDLVRTYWQ